MSGSNDHIGEIADGSDAAAIARAAERLRGGKLVAVPTETVYGLAGDASNEAAIAAIYRTKGRPDFNPLIVHVATPDAARELGVFNQLADKLVDAYWPGPLTLVVPKAPDCPAVPAVTAGLDTIALRCPAHPVMRALLQESGLALAAPSANRSGKISPTQASHVSASLGDRAPLILDGGSCDRGLESTIIGIKGADFVILRPGPITAEQVIEVAGKMPLDQESSTIEAPGQLASHYAPGKPLRLAVQTAAADEYLIGFGEVGGHENLSPSGDLAEAASRLFAALHRADAHDLPRIAVAPIAEHGIGKALNDRLRRAAH